MREAVRERNRRGEGGRLRDEILAGATELLEETGSEEAVTLRAVARQVGISAPSIYSHFEDREAIVDAIVDDAFARLQRGDRGCCRCRGKLRSGPAGAAARRVRGLPAVRRRRPNRYRVLFERQALAGDDPDPVPSIRTEQFRPAGRLPADCVDGRHLSQRRPAAGTATAIWVALHGFATLHALLPGFPWPDSDVMLDRIIDGLGQISGS